MLLPEYFFPGQDVDAVLADRLIPAEVNDGLGPRGTEKFWVEGFPEVFVRRNEVDQSAQKIGEADRGYMNLRLQGVDVLPYAVRQHAGGLYVITYKVDGQPLHEIIGSNHDREFIEGFDQLYMSLGSFLLDAWRDGRPTTLDVFSLEQYMYGTVRGGRPGIKLVDLGMDATQVNTSPGELSYLAVDFANIIVSTENELDQPDVLAHARRTTSRLFAADLERSGTDSYAAAMSWLGYTILESGRPLSPRSELANAIEHYAFT